MLRFASIGIVATAATAAIAAAQETTLSLDVSPAVIDLGQGFELTTRGSFDRGARLRYKAIQFSTIGEVIGTVACNEVFIFHSKSGGTTRWTAPRTGRYQITVTLEKEGPRSKTPEPSATAPFRHVRPQNSQVEVITQQTYPSMGITATATGQFPPGSRYMWGLDYAFVINGDVVMGTLKMETQAPVAVWTVPFGPSSAYKAVHVDVLDGNECNLIASGKRQPLS